MDIKRLRRAMSERRRRVKRGSPCLALVDVRPAVGRHINDGALFDLPHGLVELLQLLQSRARQMRTNTHDNVAQSHRRNGRDILHRSTSADNRILHGSVPQTQFAQILHQIVVDDCKRARQCAALVDVGADGLKTLCYAIAPSQKCWAQQHVASATDRCCPRSAPSTRWAWVPQAANCATRACELTPMQAGNTHTHTHTHTRQSCVFGVRARKTCDPLHVP